MENNNIEKKAAPALVLNNAFFKKVGIPIDISDDSVKAARASLIDNGATALPAETDKSANTALVVMSTVQERILAEKSAARDVSVLLASMDVSKEYAKVTDANGKPYKSTLALAKAWFPRLEHSTLANYVGTGRVGYLPAAQGAFGKKAGDIVSALPANTLAVLKSALADEKKKDAVIDALKKNPRMSKKAAQELIRDINGVNPRQARTPDNSEVNSNVAKEQLNNADTYKRCQEIVARTTTHSAADGELYLTVLDDGKADLKRMIQEALVANDAGVTRCALRALYHGIYG